ncbi:thioredoxin family protein [uncultured Winogradskyella sp.]|uniref:thioredoxin family protein n=1 Tax=uncultured Winogradskyella sp. TaxID=395353 RepID=UPI0030D84F7A|tara:strand:- start:20332 stop:20823 length:492 start_codon:yes stop_codon:yes gene_type:complete
MIYQELKYLKLHMATLLLCFSTFVIAQKQTVEWLSFEALEQALLTQPKKVMIHFYADWCVYCKKMEQDVYTKPAIAAQLSTNYYAVKFNVESTDTVAFGGKKFLNLNIGKSRTAYHQIAELLARSATKDILLPAVVFLDEEINIEKRLFRYIAPKELLGLLKD